MILCVVWHNYETLFPKNIWGYMGFNFIWICSSGVYPLTYIISLFSVPLSHNHQGDREFIEKPLSNFPSFCEKMTLIRLYKMPSLPLPNQ